MKLKLNNIENVLILGSGVLGLRIGLQSALSGFSTTIYDISQKALVNAEAIQNKILAGLIKTGRITTSDKALAKKRISWTTDPELAAENPDFISESVTEELELKKKVWHQFGQLCPPHTVFTTNTSFLLPSRFAEDTGRPGRFCAFHFHDVFKANVVDIMPHPGTETWVVALLRELGYKLHQTPVMMKKESPGYVFNAMLMAVLGAAGVLVTHDIATIEDVDRSWMGNFKTESGPFGIIDSIGLDTAWHIIKDRKDAKSIRFAALLKSYIDKDRLGLKSGEGFYTYPNPVFLREDFIERNTF